LGKVKKWSDPAVAALNPGIKLPEQAISVIHRSDGSGTTFNWADYLSKVSTEWKTKVGANTLVAWPAGSGGKGNSGVAENVTRIKGAIGYVEFAYVLQKKLTYGLVQNRAGNFVIPDVNSFVAATEGIDWEKTRDFYVLLNNAPGADAYPIVATSFVLIHKQPDNAERTRQILSFFRWALANGQELAGTLGYVPLPPSLVQRVETYWQTQIR
jgi:phosphate transport system substrate-binding protein